MNEIMNWFVQTNADARNLAIGGVVYALVTIIWLFIGVALRATNGATLGWLFVAAAGLMAVSIFAASQLPIAPATAEQSNIGRWFGIIFAWEGIFIGVGSGILVAMGRPNWILSWVALVVGLHFFPLAYLLNLRLDYVLGVCIVVLVVVTSTLDLDTRRTVLTLGTAAMLWMAGVGRLIAAYHDINV
ncbi:MAG: hypothetical protein AAFN11_14300 [Chloroflexota bacterium]